MCKSYAKQATEHGTVSITHSHGKPEHAKQHTGPVLGTSRIHSSTTFISGGHAFYCQVNALAFHNANRTERVREHNTVLAYTKQIPINNRLISQGRFALFNFVCCKGEVKSRYIIKQIKQIFIQCLKAQCQFLGDFLLCISKLLVY